ncbi:MAG: hypothetical protein ACOX4Q_07930 [Syntrophomonadales bacterium]|jgi:hypothetical protein
MQWIQFDNKLAGYRRELVLTETRLDHYDEFRQFFRQELNLQPEDVDGGRNHYFQAESGRVYELIFVGKTGRLFPAGLEILLLVKDIDPLPDEDEIDKDLWEFLRWMISGVGGEWTVEALESTGYLYRVPFAKRPARNK